MSTTTISDDMIFRGEVSYEGRLEVQGRLEGRVHSSDTFDVSLGGKVNANIRVKQVNIKGSITGNIQADSLHIFSGGNLYGDIDCDQLQVDRGGIHNGVTIMSGDENKD